MRIYLNICRPKYSFDKYLLNFVPQTYVPQTYLFAKEEKKTFDTHCYSSSNYIINPLGIEFSNFVVLKVKISSVSKVKGKYIGIDEYLKFLLWDHFKIITVSFS